MVTTERVGRYKVGLEKWSSGYNRESGSVQGRFGESGVVVTTGRVGRYKVGLGKVEQWLQPGGWVSTR